MSKLRERTIRLAATHPGLRRHLLPLLREANGQPGPAYGQPAVAPQMVMMPAPGTIMVPAAPQVIIVQPGMQVPMVMTTPPQTAHPGVPVPPAATGDSVFLTNLAQKGFDSDLAPEMNRMVAQGGMTRPEATAWAHAVVREAFATKNALYLVLIRHQSMFESDEVFQGALDRAIDNWASEGYRATTAPGS